MSLSVMCCGTGTPFVVLHGWGMNANIWQPVVPALSQYFQLHCLDLPGFGDSTWLSENDVSLETFVEQIMPALPQRFHLMGWSLGGLIATQIALEHPERVLSLNTVASSPHFVESDSWSGIQPNVLEQFQQQLDRNFKKTIERFLAIQAMGSEDAREQVKQVRQLIFTKPMPNPGVLKQALTILQTADLRPQLSKIEMPFNRFYGRLDSLVPERAIDSISTLTPKSKAVVFNKSSHAPFISEPERFVSELLRALKQ
ncbi:pimeloyl-ACP methyl ester esterase BioH [Idiomarina ramblicola]|uniref:Pimeloyl-[acyl-carrier protein] methyl ester esterase n=1 Tax=Idiomarina ramblicola TaxID=263724 RepID=A0A432YZX0_9GAMM|nr:pimeloyl-ACP methyl ester esterase BioH [Idiomarina ramblicola]RUO69447.1 pimeloyl-[acyl-carrier protein] methyl ester esterase [Idiomarina ramblicola]